MKKQTPFTELFCDDQILVVNKLAGIPVIADRYDRSIPHLDAILEPLYGKVYVVHRIDKETSGVVIFARNSNSHKTVSAAFENRLVKKTYHALVFGKPQQSDFTVSEPLLVDADSHHRTIINKNGKPSQTDFQLISTHDKFSWIKALPISGRTHQIRVHLQHCGLPIVCDSLYNQHSKPLFLS
ncbi:MAG: RluA family pseudouridine synthase, partial [Treponemataceae bacterium]